jgi:hypothetical protein
MGEPLRLFNTSQFDPERRPLLLAEVDRTPNPMPTARLSQGRPAGRPEAYVAIETYDATVPGIPQLDVGGVGLQLHVPDASFAGNTWTFRGANLCAWESGLQPRLQAREIAIDPIHGRIAIGVALMASTRWSTTCCWRTLQRRQID